MRTKLIKTITLLTALLIMLAGCAMNGSIEQSGLEGPTAEKGWTTSSRTTINNVYFQTNTYYSFFLGYRTGRGASGPIYTDVFMSPSPVLWTIKHHYNNVCSIGNLELRSGGGVSGPIMYYYVGDSNTPTKWTFNQLPSGLYTIKSGKHYLAASIGGGASGPVGAGLTVSTTPFEWVVYTAN